jgi:hypothetical protein
MLKQAGEHTSPEVRGEALHKAKYGCLQKADRWKAKIMLTAPKEKVQRDPRPHPVKISF